MHIQRWTCYIISMPSGGLVPKWSSNHNITSVLGWRKSTANIPPRLDLARPRASCSQVVHPRNWNMLHQILPSNLVNHSSLIKEKWNKDHKVFTNSRLTPQLIPFTTYPYLQPHFSFLLPSEGFHKLLEIKYLHKVLDKVFLQVLTCHSFKMAILDNFINSHLP
jgi:hypothetical protein